MNPVCGEYAFFNILRIVFHVVIHKNFSQINEFAIHVCGKFSN